MASNKKNKMIQWAEPDIDLEEFKYVKDCFKKNRFTMGDKVKKLEMLMARNCGSKYAIAVNNGTIALDLAYKAINIKKNDEVILPAISYISSATSISYQGATPVFVDIDLNTGCINPNEIEKAITKKTKAISFIDYGGRPANLKEIRKISKKHNIPIVLDGAQSLGGKYNGEKLGAGGLISTMSFHMAKIMTTVEGGMIFTNKKNLYEKIKLLRNIGENPLRKYKHIELGTNARMNEIQAAIGLAQFKKLNYFINSRARIARLYSKLFSKNKNITLLNRNIDKKSSSSNFFFPVLINNRDIIAKKLREKFYIDTRIAYPMPIYKQELYKNIKFKKLKCSNAVKFGNKILNLPIYPSLSDKKVKYIANILNKLCN